MQVPLLILCYHLLHTHPGLCPEALVYLIVQIQFLYLCWYLNSSNLFVLDIPREARRMLLARSVFYTVGIVCFVKALKLISPVALLAMQGTAAIVNTCLFRLRRACFRKGEFGFIVPAFCGAVVCFCVIGGRLKHYGVDIVDGGRGADFMRGAGYGTVSGLMLAKVSRVSQALSKENLLPHEALMQFYATMMASTTILYTMIPDQQTRLANQSEI